MTLLRGLLSAGLTLPSLAHFYGYVSPKRGVPGKQVRLIVRSPAKGTYFIEFWDDIAGVGRLVTRYTDAQVDLLKGTRNVTKKNGVIIAFDAEDVRQAVAYLLRQEEKARNISGLGGLGRFREIGLVTRDTEMVAYDWVDGRGQPVRFKVDVELLLPTEKSRKDREPLVRLIETDERLPYARRHAGETKLSKLHDWVKFMPQVRYGSRTGFSARVVDPAALLVKLDEKLATLPAFASSSHVKATRGFNGLGDVRTMRLKELQEQAALALAKAAQHAQAGHGALARVWRNAAARLQRELEARLVELR